MIAVLKGPEPQSPDEVVPGPQCQMVLEVDIDGVHDSPHAVIQVVDPVDVNLERGIRPRREDPFPAGEEVPAARFLTIRIRALIGRCQRPKTAVRLAALAVEEVALQRERVALRELPIGPESKVPDVPGVGGLAAAGIHEAVVAGIRREGS